MVDHVRKDTLRTSCKDKMTKNMENRIEGWGRSAINGIVIQRRAGSVGYHCGLYRLQSQIQFHHEQLIPLSFPLEVVIMYYATFQNMKSNIGVSVMCTKIYQTS